MFTIAVNLHAGSVFVILHKETFLILGPTYASVILSLRARTYRHTYIVWREQSSLFLSVWAVDKRIITKRYFMVNTVCVQHMVTFSCVLTNVCSTLNR